MIRVLVVDDSALVRKTLCEGLAKFDDIEVVGAAMDPFAARDKIVELEPDVLTLDIEMPRMDGLTFLAKLMKHHPMPVVIVSSIAQENSETALKALSLGAVDVVPKPGSQYSVPDVQRVLARAVRAAANARVGVSHAPSRTTPAPGPIPAIPKGGSQFIAIGSSTGGTIALERLLSRLPQNIPGLVICQHMPVGFTRGFAERLDRLSTITVKEAADGDEVRQGVALIAPAGTHMLLWKSGSRYLVRTKDGPPVHHQRPSVDVLFQTVAREAGPNAVGVILTGMGADGAAGLLEMRRAGAHTMAQDEASCVVFGMPKRAIDMGAAVDILPLDSVPDRLCSLYACHAFPVAA